MTDVMQGTTDYATIATLISDVESSNVAGQIPKSITIDTAAALSTQFDSKPYDYDAACAKLGYVDVSKVAPEMPSSQYVKPGMQTGNIVQEQGQYQSEQIKRVISKVSEGVAPQQQVITPVKSNMLVLPGLSTQEQINELEQIGEGLDEGAFNEEQLRIIGLELVGLNEKVKFERVPTSDKFQKSLSDLRNKLLESDRNKFFGL